MTQEKQRRKRWRHGRASINPADIRGFIIGVRANHAELSEIQAKAKEMNLPVGRFLRQAALARVLPRRSVPELNRKAYGELARMGGNLNQMARAANQGNITLSAQFFFQLKGLLEEVRLALLGVQQDDREAD